MKPEEAQLPSNGIKSSFQKYSKPIAQENRKLPLIGL